jgi:hypothetical protein
MLALQALDDPVSTWRNAATNHGWMHPDNLLRTDQGNLVVVLAKRVVLWDGPLDGGPLQEQVEMYE